MIVLNDNDMSISTNVGAMSGYLNSIIKGQRYNQAKDLAKGVMDRIPLVGGKLHGLAHDMEQLFKHMIVPGTLFEELGFKYLGPYDGHDLDFLIDLFEENKDYNGPLLDPRHHEEGEGLRAGGEQADLVARRDAVRHRVGRGEEVRQAGAADATRRSSPRR